MEVGFRTQTIAIAPMLPGDVDRIMPIERDIYSMPWTAGNFRDSLRAGYQGWLLIDSATQTEVSGYCVVMQALDETHLLNLSVAASYQRLGLGRRMLQWLMRDARSRGASGMFLEVRPSNLAAIELYRHAGFLEVGRRPGYYPTPDRRREDALVMRSDLSQLGHPDSVRAGAL